MSKIIKIDEKSRIRITSRNHILEYWEKTEPTDGKEGSSEWRVDGFFANMVQCVTEYILNAPRASCEPTEDIKELIKVIKAAESRIAKIFTN